MPVVETNSRIEALKSIDDAESKSPSEIRDVVHQDILQALQGLQFGEVTITVRDGRVVQIERITRRRQILSKQKE